MKSEAEEGKLLDAHRMASLEHTVGKQQELSQVEGKCWHGRSVASPMVCSPSMPSLSALPHLHTKKQETLKMICAQDREYNMKLSKYSY